MTNAPAANESILEIAVNAASRGHDLTGFEKVDGYEASRRKCGRTAWVGYNGLMYRMLDSECNLNRELLSKKAVLCAHFTLSEPNSK
jgi:hypothetical protein